MDKLFPKAIICIVYHYIVHDQSKYLEGCLCKCIVNLKILIFHVYFFNMDISFITALTCLKTCMSIAEIFSLWGEPCLKI